jgi:hypothetical protein
LLLHPTYTAHLPSINTNNKLRMQKERNPVNETKVIILIQVTTGVGGEGI